ncbi:MAG: S-ribosylhomocysteine lyase [Clostridiales bacterium]|jgi:S-ribosylhomocysteine lyase|nr:S-ribosylhomocysteine lyase [Clostridiales bacterium]
MERIASFNVDHNILEPGIYISRIDGDITTYDLRVKKPNGELMSNAEMHSTEHLFATMARNSEIKDDVIYFGPMGCQTGYYLLVRNADNARILDVIKRTLRDIIGYTGEMPGKSAAECGNYANLDIEIARESCRRYYEAVKDKGVEDLKYR